MNFLSFLFASKKTDSPDRLGRYPEYMQISALPERRYMKTARFLAVLIIINIAFMTAFAGMVVYITDRVSVSIANKRVVNLYTIDSSSKTIVPAEYEEKRYRATDLYVEKVLREYIQNRHSVVWDNTRMREMWGSQGPVSQYSHYKAVFNPFQTEADTLFSESRSAGFVRDVHLYELKQLTGTFWEGMFETFDMPIPDPYNPVCGMCTDNSPACISCKAKITSRRQRFRVYIRANFVGTPTIDNPLGILVLSYNLLYVPIHEDEKFWNLPPDLKPNL